LPTSRGGPVARLPALERGVIAHEDLGRFMARNSRSFRFAALAMERAERERVQRVYAWCRHTDDLVDGRIARGESVPEAAHRLDRWQARSQAAFEGRATGDAVLDRTMAELRDAGGSFTHPQAIIDGVRSDLTAQSYESMCDLRGYSYNVASAVGLWLCALVGVRHPWMLSRAAALGHAMQLTNILRDVGEDLDSGRLYIPRTVLEDHALSRDDLIAMRRRLTPIDGRYRDLVESLMRLADDDYALADEAIPFLPGSFRLSVQLASRVYQRIHDAIRANDYDNLSRRARTSAGTKLTIAATSFWSTWWNRERVVRLVTETTPS